MDAIKLLMIVFCVPLFMNAQKTKFPKDTVYIKFENKKDPYDWHGKFNREYRNEKGFFFNIKDSLGDMVLFYNCKSKTDTLPISSLKNYQTLNLEEIKVKEIDWVERKFAKSRYKPYKGSKNSVFITYLIEIISKEKFVIYPVIWRNEGVID